MPEDLIEKCKAIALDHLAEFRASLKEKKPLGIPAIFMYRQGEYSELAIPEPLFDNWNCRLAQEFIHAAVRQAVAVYGVDFVSCLNDCACIEVKVDGPKTKAQLERLVEKGEAIKRNAIVIQVESKQGGVLLRQRYSVSKRGITRCIGKPIGEVYLPGDDLRGLMSFFYYDDEGKSQTIQ